MRMLPEGKALRDNLSFLKSITSNGESEHKITMKLITALTRAVRADCLSTYESNTYPQDRNQEIVRAIRGKR